MQEFLERKSKRCKCFKVEKQTLQEYDVVPESVWIMSPGRRKMDWQISHGPMQTRCARHGLVYAAGQTENGLLGGV